MNVTGMTCEKTVASATTQKKDEDWQKTDNVAVYKTHSFTQTYFAIVAIV